MSVQAVVCILWLTLARCPCRGVIGLPCSPPVLQTDLFSLPERDWDSEWQMVVNPALLSEEGTGEQESAACALRRTRLALSVRLCCYSQS